MHGNVEVYNVRIPVPWFKVEPKSLTHTPMLEETAQVPRKGDYFRTSQVVAWLARALETEHCPEEGALAKKALPMHEEAAQMV